MISDFYQAERINSLRKIFIIYFREFTNFGKILYLRWSHKNFSQSKEIGQRKRVRRFQTRGQMGSTTFQIWL